MGHQNRKEDFFRKQKIRVQAIVEYVLEEVEKFPEKIGVLLCEGEENSFDKLVYEAVFPELVIIPLGSCTTIMRSLSKVKKTLAASNLFAFGIIDRDALSKPEIKRMLDERDVYTTKLPFIENIVCTPKVIRFMCEYLELNYEVTLEKIEEQMMKALWQKLKEALPINLGIEKKERIDTLQIGASTKNKTIKKVVDRENILYAYRSKVIVSIVASQMHMHDSKEYCEKLRQMLADERYHANLAKAMSDYVPKLKLYDFEEV